MTNKIKSNFHVCSPNAFILSFSAHYSNRVIHNSNIISYKKEGPTALLVLKRRSKITWGWGTAMRNLGVPFSYFFRKLGVPSKNKNLSCYYLFAKKENN